jgi:hypothetical protein
MNNSIDQLIDTSSSSGTITIDEMRSLQLSRDQATSALAAKVAHHKAREAYEASERTAAAERAGRAALAAPKPDAAEARAKLSDPAFQDRLMAGSPAARQALGELTSVVAADRTDAAIAGTLPLSQEIQTTTTGQISDHKLMGEIAHLREQFALPDNVIKQIIDGPSTPISSAERAAAVEMKRALLADEAWAARYLSSNNFAERRQMLLLNAILCAPVAA